MKLETQKSCCYNNWSSLLVSMQLPSNTALLCHMKALKCPTLGSETSNTKLYACLVIDKAWLDLSSFLVVLEINSIHLARSLSRATYKLSGHKTIAWSLKMSSPVTVKEWALYRQKLCHGWVYGDFHMPFMVHAVQNCWLDVQNKWKGCNYLFNKTFLEKSVSWKPRKISVKPTGLFILLYKH